MTVFNTVFKIVKKYKFTIILYTIILITFTGFNFTTSDKQMGFTGSKPDILVVNKDSESKLTSSFVKYLKKQANVISEGYSEDEINDALFYRDVNYVIYIPMGFGDDFLEGKNPPLKIKSTNDYPAVLAEEIVNRYIGVLNTYLKSGAEEGTLIKKIENTLDDTVNIEVHSKIDSDKLAKVSHYFNFLNYSILAGLVYVICLILTSFKSEGIRKRTLVSSTDYRKLNRKLLLANLIVGLVLWAFYIILSLLLLGTVMFSIHGLIYIANSLVFMVCALFLAFLLGNMINNKAAVNGVINVVALGSSFLCGAFVPMEYLPDFVLNIAHVLPSYWYIKNNELIKTIEVFNFDSLRPLLINALVLCCFAVLFIIITNLITKRKEKIG